jgi:hypothetical protein
VLLHHYSEILVDVSEPLVICDFDHVFQILLDVQLVFKIKLFVFNKITGGLFLDIMINIDHKLGLRVLKTFDMLFKLLKGVIHGDLHSKQLSDCEACVRGGLTGLQF